MLPEDLLQRWLQEKWGRQIDRWTTEPVMACAHHRASHDHAVWPVRYPDALLCLECGNRARQEMLAGPGLCDSCSDPIDVRSGCSAYRVRTSPG